MILKGAARGAVLAAPLALALAACGGEPSTVSPAATGLVATTTIWADITSHVACGEAVTALIPAGADPHTFEPSLRDHELLDHTAFVIANGSKLEESLLDLLATVDDDGTDVVEMTAHVDLLNGDLDIGEIQALPANDQDPEIVDPHIWQDPVRVAGALDVIASALIASGRDADRIHACTEAYRVELEQLDAEIADLLASIPAGRRLIVTNHDAFSYFAVRYGFEVVGTVIPSISTIAETSAAQLVHLSAVIADNEVPAIFTEQLASDAEAESLADRLDVLVVPLTADSLDSQGPESTYIGMLRSNAQAIAAALG
jgi:zinc/manganese transport system substrate-binding protein